MAELDPELAILAGRIDVLIARVRAARSIAARRFALDVLARALHAADPGSVDAPLRAEALELRVDASTVAAASAPRLAHAVAVPLVARASNLGFVRQVYVTFDPVGLVPDDLLQADALRAISDAIGTAARFFSPPSAPGLHRLVFAQPLALRQARVEGRSLSAAAFVSAASLWTDRPVRSDVAVSGELRGEALLGVGEITSKVHAAIAHGMRALVVPASNEASARAALERATEVGLTIIGVTEPRELLDAALEAGPGQRVSPSAAVDEARRIFAAGWRGYRWPSVRAELARLSGTLPSYRLDLRVEVLARVAAAQRHLGDPVGSLTLLFEAESLAKSEDGRRSVPDSPLSVLYQQIAMTCRQLCRFSEAARFADRAANVARRARLSGDLIKALGCVGLVAMSRARIDRAIEGFAESLDVVRAYEPERSARTHAYLTEAFAAAGRGDEAAAHYREAMDELERAGADSDRRARESWVRTSFGGALLRLGRAREAIEVLDASEVRISLAEDPLPGLLARRYLGVALCAAGDSARGFELLAASPLVHGRALEPHLSFAAHLNVLFEARARIEAGAWGNDIAGRALRALEHVPRYGRVSAFLGRSLAGTRRLLEKNPRTTEPLATLLARCERLV